MINVNLAVLMISGIFILLGANLGNIEETFEKARSMLEQDVEISGISSLYGSTAWGYESQPDFINQVLKINSKLEPTELLNKLQSIERKLGRTERIKWRSRYIDIDLLYYNDEKIDTEDLIVPHPHLHERRFTLVPLNEIAPDFIHPLLQKSQQELLQECKDPGEVWKVKD